MPCSVQNSRLEGGLHQVRLLVRLRSPDGNILRELQTLPLSSQGDEQRLYEFIVRHFLACCSQDAQGQETTVEIDIAQERFVAHGLMILARNYLDVYPYDHWSDKVIKHRPSQRSEFTSPVGLGERGRRSGSQPSCGPMEQGHAL